MILLVQFLLFFFLSRVYSDAVITKTEEDKDKVVWTVKLPSDSKWWQLDMESDHLVSTIHVISGNNTNGTASRELTISVLSKEGEEKVCLKVEDSAEATLNTTYNCFNHPKYTRFVNIRRPDGMPLAEVKVFAKKAEAPESLINKQNLNQLVQESYVVLNSNSATQCGTWHTHGANLAIDNNEDTYNVACVKCDHTLSGGVGWWQVDLMRDRAVVGVKVVTSKDHYNAKYFNDLKVLVGSTRSTDPRDTQTCFEFSTDHEYPPGKMFEFRCKSSPLVGRFLTIRRNINARFRPDAIAIAEVKVIENPNYPQLAFETKIFDNSSIILSKNSAGPVKNPIKAIQSGTYGNHYASLALDGNPSTWSIADTNMDSKYKGQTAWWEADLGKEYTIDKVVVTASTDSTNSKYLRDISVGISSTSIANGLNSLVNCASYQGDITPGQNIELKCHRPTQGRYVQIRRVSNTAYRPDALTLAEVRISYK